MHRLADIPSRYDTVGRIVDSIAVVAVAGVTVSVTAATSVPTAAAVVAMHLHLAIAVDKSAANIVVDRIAADMIETVDKDIDTAAAAAKSAAAKSTAAEVVPGDMALFVDHDLGQHHDYDGHYSSCHRHHDCHYDDYCHDFLVAAYPCVLALVLVLVHNLDAPIQYIRLLRHPSHRPRKAHRSFQHLREQHSPCPSLQL